MIGIKIINVTPKFAYNPLNQTVMVLKSANYTMPPIIDPDSTKINITLLGFPSLVTYKDDYNRTININSVSFSDVG
jgi:hypothetical protein